MIKKIIIFANSIEPDGISGSETILIELFKRLSKKISVTVYTWKVGEKFYRQHGLDRVHYVVSKVPYSSYFYVSFFIRSLYGIWLGITHKIENTSTIYIYAGSDFWPDSIPAILLKLRYPKVKLIATFYLKAPNPFKGFNEQGNFTLPAINGIFYWSMQYPVYYCYKKLADFIIVTSKPDVERFPRQKEKKRVFVVQGGVDVEKVEQYLKENPHVDKEYDAVFMGRFHPQKGVIELIDIWKKVVKVMPSAKLALIGDGQVMPTVKQKIKSSNLDKNVTIFGVVLDAHKRFDIFSKSKIVVHPATYDSGGMAAAEAMSFGLPAVSFDLEALKTYYPKGMLKVSLGNTVQFANKIQQLLNDEGLYNKISKDAAQLVRTEWDWNERANNFYQFLLE